jgi:hypothetical protein
MNEGEWEGNEEKQEGRNQQDRIEKKRKEKDRTRQGIP